MKLTRCKNCGLSRRNLNGKCFLPHDFETIEVFTKEEVRKRLLTEQVANAMEVEALDPLGIGCSAREKRTRVLETALDRAFDQETNRDT